ncbi:MAG TPA: hypothetical protein VM536_07810, partial [Chloroflexia bacterium]|nr:hypothetical protein [Chloroflexia bacterium]
PLAPGEFARPGAPSAAAAPPTEPAPRLPEIAAPGHPAPILRQLGPPPFWTPPAAFAGHLEPVYAAVTAALLRLAHGEEEME